MMALAEGIYGGDVVSNGRAKGGGIKPASVSISARKLACTLPPSPFPCLGR